ncbi:MAG: phosphatase PAP2 family protein [Ferruginibacter sp.]|nr:phosphatase PAP2 family protein [Ferruginibacter sp.]
MFTKINQDWTNTYLDNVFPLWREGITWAPLYIFLLIFVLVNFGNKAWPWIIGLLVTVALTDQISSHVLKPLVNRPRPCHDTLLADHIRLLLNYCSDSRSFTSSHATNHFGLAFFIYYTLKPYFKNWGYCFFLWAATISYGQVYIGVHYPSDVICGALLGSSIGYFTSLVFNRKISLPSGVPKTDRIRDI